MFNLFLVPLFIKVHGTPDVYSTPAFRLMEFFMGVILMHLYQFRLKDSRVCKKWLYTWKALCIEMSALVVTGGYMVYVQFEVGNFSLYNWIVIPLFVAQILTLIGLDAKLLRHKIVSYLSATAYCVYLAQYFCWSISTWFYSISGVERNTFRIIISALVCMLLASLLHELIEKKAKKFFMKWVR